MPLKKEAEFVRESLNNIANHDIVTPIEAVKFKDLFSLFLLCTQKGYVLDTNVRPFVNFHRVLESSNQDIVFDDLPVLSAVRSPDSKSIGDFYLMYSPERELSEALDIFNDWCRDNCSNNISVLWKDDIYILPSLQDNRRSENAPYGLFKCSFKSYQQQFFNLFYYYEYPNDFFKKVVSLGDINSNLNKTEVTIQGPSKQDFIFTNIEKTSLLHFLIMKGDIEKVKILIENKAQLDVKAKIKVKDNSDNISILECTPLELAVYLEAKNVIDPEMLELIRQAKLNNQVNNEQLGPRLSRGGELDMSKSLADNQMSQLTNFSHVSDRASLLSPSSSSSSSSWALLQEIHSYEAYLASTQTLGEPI